MLMMHLGLHTELTGTLIIYTIEKVYRSGYMYVPQL